MKILIKENVFYKLEYNQSLGQLDVFRIGVALFSLISMLVLLIDYPLVLAPNGLMNWEVTNANCFWFEPHPYKISKLFNLSDSVVIVTCIGAYLAALIGLIIGVWVRLCAIFALILFVTLTNVMAPYCFGVDVYQTVCLFYLCISPIGYHYALSPKKISDKIIKLQQIAMRGIQFYLIITYLSAGVEKGLMSSWWNGEFIYFVLSDPTILTTHAIPTNWHYLVYAFLGSSVVILESTYFLCVWIPYIRTISIVSIIVMHIFIGIYMELLSFGILLTLLNIVCWYPVLIEDFKKIRTIFFSKSTKNSLTPLL